MDQEKCLPQHAVTVEMNVRYHSSQKTTDLFIAENVSKSINHKNAAVALDLVVDRVMVEDQATEVPGLVEVQETIDQEKCLPQHAVTVEMNVRYHSSQKTIDLFIAENVSKITDKTSKSF
jgi:acyl-coenzyme A thioesterase PaaI-like protein